MKYNYPLYSSVVKYTDIRHFISDVPTRFGDKIALSYRTMPHDKEAVRVTYSTFAEDVRALGTELLARGLYGKHLALIGALSYEWVCVYFATLACGIVLVPLDKEWTAEDLSATVSCAECAYLVCDSNIEGKVEVICKDNNLPTPTYTSHKTGETISQLIASGKERIAAGDTSFDTVKIDPTKLALLVFTSGTTGQGKGVMLNQQAILANDYYGLQIITAQGKTIAVLPPHHTFGSTVGLFMVLTLGAEIYISSGLKYIPRELQQEQPNFLVMVPLFLETFHRRIWASIKEKGKEKLVRRMMKLSNALRKVGIDLRRKFFGQVLSAFGGKVTMAVCGGAPLNPEVANDFDAFGVAVQNGYGITECAPLIAANRNKGYDPTSVGMLVPCDELKFVDVADDGEGEICVKGPNVMMGYWKNEEATREAIDEDGFFHTGDFGRQDKYGRLFITGRKKNLIILSNGKNVYPEEIETAISIATPGITDIVVYEGESERGIAYNTVVAEIHPDFDYFQAQNIPEDQIEAYFHQHVENYNRTAVPYKKIGMVRIRQEAFPKNTLRKIVRFKINKQIP